MDICLFLSRLSWIGGVALQSPQVWGTRPWGTAECSADHAQYITEQSKCKRGNISFLMIMLDVAALFVPKKQIGLLCSFQKRERMLVLEWTPLCIRVRPIHSIVSARRENLIVGESLRSTEVMNVVEVSKAKDLKIPCGEMFFLLIYSDSGLQIRACGCMFIYKSTWKPTMNEQTSA